MFGHPFLHIQLLQFVFSCLALLAAYATWKNRVLSFVAVYGVAVWFLVWKSIEYGGSGRLPMDISAICYFLYGIVAILPVRPAKTAVAQIAALCGLVYSICMMSMPQIFFARDPNQAVEYFAIVNHSLLLFGGLAMLGHIRFKWTDVFWTVAVVGAVAAYIEICISLGVEEGTAIFSQILDGSVILVIAPNFSMRWWYYVLYYTVTLSIFALWIALTYALNRKAAAKVGKSGFFAV